jgi:hypothetical protein
MTWYLFSCLLCVCGMFVHASRNIMYFIRVQKMNEEHIEGEYEKGAEDMKLQ